MKKTISINLAGFAFQIDEDAYQILSKYLESLKSKFSKEDEKAEIIGDIEYRISEIFTSKLKASNKEVISELDVQEIIKKLGKPEDIAGEEQSSSQQNTNNASFNQGNTNSEKRLYRNPEEKMIGGVCSGLSVYLGINDPLWIRVLFLLLMFFSAGSITIIYLIAMVIIPEAKTTSQKLQMRGLPVNLKNIEEGFTQFRDTLNNPSNSQTLHRIFQFFYKIFKYFFAALFFVIGFGLLTFVAMIFFKANISWFTTSFILQNYIIANPFYIGLASAGLALMIGIPAISFILLGARIVIQRPFMKSLHRWIMLVLWIIGIAVFTLIAFKSSHEIRGNGTTETITMIPSASQHFILKSEQDIEFDVSEDGLQINGQEIPKGKLMYPDAHLNILMSGDDKMYIKRIGESRGKSNGDAMMRAKEIDGKMEIVDSILFVSRMLEVKSNPPLFRGQELNYELYLPMGKSIYLDHSSKDLIYDIKNITDTHDSKMVGHTWLMTSSGLKCTDCNFSASSEWDSDEEDDDKSIIRIDGGDEKVDMKGVNVHIKDGDKEVRIKDGKILIRDGEEKKTIEIKK
ncbi:MAG: PspC domain-containing protein [Bacteroidetes bacterium]|nr:PspC domain-containing protein [Bacteroidota bacterium]